MKEEIECSNCKTLQNAKHKYCSKCYALLEKKTPPETSTKSIYQGGDQTLPQTQPIEDEPEPKLPEEIEPTQEEVIGLRETVEEETTEFEATTVAGPVEELAEEEEEAEQPSRFSFVRSQDQVQSMPEETDDDITSGDVESTSDIIETVDSEVVIDDIEKEEIVSDIDQTSSLTDTVIDPPFQDTPEGIDEEVEEDIAALLKEEQEEVPEEEVIEAAEEEVEVVEAEEEEFEIPDIPLDALKEEDETPIEAEELETPDIPIEVEEEELTEELEVESLEKVSIEEEETTQQAIGVTIGEVVEDTTSTVIVEETIPTIKPTTEQEDINTRTALVCAISTLFLNCFILPIIGLAYVRRATRFNEDPKKIKVTKVFNYIFLVYSIIATLGVTGFLIYYYIFR